MNVAKNNHQEPLVFYGRKQMGLIRRDLSNWLENTSISKSRYNKIGNVLILSCFSSIILYVFILTFWQPNQTFKVIYQLILFLLILIPVGSLIGFIFSKTKANTYKKISKHEYRTQVSEKIIELLNRDIDEESIIDLKVSYKSHKDASHKLSTTNHPRKAGWKIYNYRNEWLSVRGTFVDKTNFYLTVAELSKTAYGTKRSRSGKIKSKSKDKNLGLELSLICRYPQKRYGAIQVLKDELIKALKVPADCQTKKIKLTNKSLIWVVRLSPHLSTNPEKIYQAIIMMFLSLYQILNLAKKLTK
ncbi:MAG: hypothetical protein AAF378_01590 [Cyanobacteria bacterium P01_A01_bin.84]